MNNTDFSNVKVGDVVWVYDNDVLASQPMVVHRVDAHEFYVIKMTYAFYKSNGKYVNNNSFRCFWDKVEIVAPPRPKKMVKKTGHVLRELIHGDCSAPECIKVEYEVEE